MKLKNYQDYYLQISSDTALSMTFVGLLMDGIGEYVVWGVVAAATVLSSSGLHFSYAEKPSHQSSPGSSILRCSSQQPLASFSSSGTSGRPT